MTWKSGRRKDRNQIWIVLLIFITLVNLLPTQVNCGENWYFKVEGSLLLYVSIFSLIFYRINIDFKINPVLFQWIWPTKQLKDLCTHCINLPSQVIKTELTLMLSCFSNYRISSYSCRGNYSFLNSSSEETIQVFISLM